MTQKELQNLAALKKEIEMEQKRLRDMRRKEGKKRYCIPGLSAAEFGAELPEAVLHKTGTLEKQIEQHIDLYMDELLRLERFIESIPESKMRMVFRLRYMMEKTWQQIAFAIGEYDESYPRRKHNAYLKAVEKTERTFL